MESVGYPRPLLAPPMVLLATAAAFAAIALSARLFLQHQLASRTFPTSLRLVGSRWLTQETGSFSVPVAGENVKNFHAIVLRFVEGASPGAVVYP